MQYRLCYKCSVWRTSFCILSGGGGMGLEREWIGLNRTPACCVGSSALHLPDALTLPHADTLFCRLVFFMQDCSWHSGRIQRSIEQVPDRADGGCVELDGCVVGYASVCSGLARCTTLPPLLTFTLDDGGGSMAVLACPVHYLALSTLDLVTKRRVCLERLSCSLPHAYEPRQRARPTARLDCTLDHRGHAALQRRAAR